MMNDRNHSLLIGGSLILVGLLLLVINLDIIYVEPAIVVALAFMAGAGFLFIRFLRQDKFGFLVVAAILFFIGSAIYIEETRIVRDDYIAVLLFWGSALLFGLGYLRNPQKWGLLIPAGVLFTIGGMIVIDQARFIPDDLMGGTFFLGLGLTFFLLYSIRNDQNKLEWAKLPAIILIGFSGFIYFVSSHSAITDLIFPILLIGLGGYLVYRATQNGTATKGLSGA